MEVWKSVKGYEWLYEVSNLGRVKGLEKVRVIGNGGIRVYPETIFKSCRNTKGYCVVILRDYGYNKTFSVHRLVAEHFIDNPNSLRQVNHKNGVKSDNRVENLEWCTYQENNAHAKRTGLLRSEGELNYMSKLNSTQVLKIRSLKGIKSIKELSAEYSVTKESIYNIWKFGTWKHI